jgi:hypothetical protein
MTTMSSPHPREAFGQRREHPEGTLAVAVIVGMLGLAWFIVWVWTFLDRLTLLQ